MNPFSKLWTTKMSDVQRALVMAIIAAPLGILFDWATIANYQFSWQGLIKGAIAGGIGYIIKNFMTGINGNILTNSPKSLVTGGVDVQEITKPK
jgi:hypothetical protein